MKPSIVIQTDFSLSWGAVAEMKGVMKQVDPGLDLVDLCHEIRNFDPWEASLSLATVEPYWAPGTIFVSVVDPGVGTSRRASVALLKDGSYVVTPDNGSLTHLLHQVGIEEICEIDEKVNEAAKILGLEQYLDRKPKALSGGQRQRVAMGRAIVRSPKVFLMDEPLSNLDAKLRVQMRSEISKLHERLGTTIIYVTHDQTEAMTLGTRIVVMKDGIVQQINTPDFLYKMPVNLFVAGFIGSPQMNFMDAVVELKDGDAYLHIGDNTLKVPDDRKSALIDGNYDGKTVVLGIRPENIKDDPDFLAAHADSQVKSKIDVKEMLGAEVFLYFDVNGHQTIARVEPETPYNNGDDAVFALDMTKIHLFDKDTELNLLYKE